MRTLSYLFCLVTIAGCTAPPPGPDPQLEANKNLVMKFAEAQNNWDYAALQELTAPNLRRHCQATPDADVRSSDEFIGLLRAWEGITPDANVEITDMLAEGDRVAVRAIFTGTQSGQMGDIPPTGKAFESIYLAILRVENGRIAEIWVEWDNLAIMSQLGVFPPPGQG